MAANRETLYGRHEDQVVPGVKLRGLSELEAAKRLRQDGPNELPSARPRSALRIAGEVLREPMFLLLIGTGAVYLLLGDPQEAAALLVAIFVIIVIEFYQERKTERALQALRDLSSPRALVVREGARRRIAGREVVCGDLVVVSEGDRIPADGILVEELNLSLDESLLTGESVPVTKVRGTAQDKMQPPGGDRLPCVFSGTLVVKGRGIFEVHTTGLRSELGKIGKSLESLQQEAPRLQRETNRLVKLFAIAAILLCSGVAAIYGYTHSNWLQGTLAGLTLAISMVPEEFPVVLTVFLALGAWRMSRQNVLTRRAAAIDSLGAATVLCVDKTGTLTLNRMSVQRLFAGGHWCSIDHDSPCMGDAWHELVEYSILASNRDPFDPMEKAFHELGQRFLAGSEHLHRDWELAREYALTSQLPAMSRAWLPTAGGAYVVALKGAPEAIMQLCRMTPRQMQDVTTAVSAMASQGLRVLGAGKASWQGDLPPDQRDIPFEFVGLVGLADPVRPTVPAAVSECHRAGIRVVMITGDYPVTAQNIAAQIGLKHSELVITGADLNAMDDAELRRRVRAVNVFARVVPEQKLRLVSAFKANGEVVAMTGDGVNDAPALKAADIGIAMGNRGTDVAREAAALVLLDDNFSSIVNAIRMGRRIYDNLKKATAYVLAIHVPIAGVTLVPVLLGWPLLLMPVHVLFLELIIDPACSVAFESEPEEARVMARPPRDPKQKLFAGKRVLLSLAQGFTVLSMVLAVYAAFLHFGKDEMEARALAFSTLVIGNLSLIFTNRSWTRTVWQTWRSHNRALWLVTGGAIVTLIIVLYAPALRSLFHFSLLHPDDLLIAGSAGFAGVLWFELMKLIGRGLRRGAGSEVSA
jgi:P-type Ca2+ transporter type 2C